jgi:hypothetical protein
MEETQDDSLDLAKIPSLLQATASSAGYAVACLGGSWLLWHYADHGLAFAPGLGATSMTEAGEQARGDTLFITLGTLLASVVFW